MISSSQLSNYQEQGYAIIRGVFSNELLNEIKNEVNRVLSDSSIFNPNNLRCRYHLQSDTGARLLEAIDPLTDLSPLFAEIARHSTIRNLLNELFQEEPCLFKDKLILKPPGARGYPLHQDYIHWPFFPKTFTTVVIALDQATRENGCIEVFPTLHSHDSFAPLDGEFHDLPDTILKGISPVFLELEPGDMALFGVFMPHRSAPNPTNRSRRQLYFSYNAESDGGEQRDFHYRDYLRWLRKRYTEFGSNELFFR